jgi:hypothetical protein
MRDLLNKLQSLNESVGLANRKQGETFINDKGDMLTFVGINFYPNEGKFNDASEVEDQIIDIEARHQQPIEFTNQINARMLGFGIVSFKDPDGNMVLFGRYFASINPIFHGNFWPNSGLPNGFRYNKASANKMTAGLMPQDVLPNMENQTPASILEQVVTKFGPTHPLTHLANAVCKGQQLPIYVDTSEYPDLSFEGVRDYFCEILQPIALLNNLTVGNAGEAFTAFFGKAGLKGCTITFGSGKNTGLYDSLIVSPSGKEIKVSTKGKTGASASVGNLVEAIKDLELSGNTELRTQYADIIDIVDVVRKGGHVDGPLNLAEQFGLISGKESDIVRSLKTNNKTPLTKNLQKLYDERAAGADAEKMVPYYNMLAAVAYRVAEYVNENTDFSNAAADILNHSALIQVYTTAKQAEGRFILTQFKSVYPSTLIAGVQFSAAKTYYSSGNKGNFTFKILSNGASAEQETGPSPSAAAVDQDTDAAVADVVNKHVKVTPSRSVSADRERKTSGSRERR